MQQGQQQAANAQCPANSIGWPTQLEQEQGQPAQAVLQMVLRQLGATGSLPTGQTSQSSSRHVQDSSSSNSSNSR
jgi:hypothetical protein